MTTVSLAMCTYNGERFLQQLLDSLASQTRKPDEVVVCDDCSTDNTVAILKRWAENVPFKVRFIINDENLGYTKNFEKVLHYVTGDIIFLCDQDDVWLPHKIETILNVFDSNAEIGLVYHNTKVIDESGNDLQCDEVKLRGNWRLSDYPRQLSPNLIKHPIMSGCCMAIRSELLKKMFPVEPYMLHDVWIYLYAPAFADVYTINEPLILYRYHGNNASLSSDWEKQIHRYDWNLKNYYKNETYISIKSDLQTSYYQKKLEQLEDSPRKKKLLNYYFYHKNRIRNRERIQRNFIVFSPLFVYELITLKYFYGPNPFKSMCYDLITGLINSFKIGNWAMFYKRFFHES